VDRIVRLLISSEKSDEPGFPGLKKDSRAEKASRKGDGWG